MSKVQHLVKMDFMTIKPYSGIKTSLALLIVGLFLITMSGNIVSSMGAGLMFAMLFMTYPFVLSDKNNLDALYPTLGLDRKSVVKGRYLFVLLLNIGSVAIAFILGCVGKFIAPLIGLDFSDDMGTVWLFSVAGVAFIAIQALQLPIFFKYGYQKTKFFIILPIAVVSGGIGIIGGNNGGELLSKAITFLTKIQEHKVMMFSIIIVALIVLIIISYNLSVIFYKKREF